MNTNELLIQASHTSVAAALLTQACIKQALESVARRVMAQTAAILEANQLDLAKMEPSNPKYDRLLLTAERIEAMANDVINVSNLPSPVGKIIKEMNRPNGMSIQQVAVPFGVIGVIYEARPNVTLDVFSLCLRTNNVCVLKGGSDAEATNQAIVRVIHQTLSELSIPLPLCTLLPSDREATAELLNAVGIVDVIIPRGSSALIDYVRTHARVPVIETGAGVCHAYIDNEADIKIAQAVVVNAKTRRVSVCNALDCLLINNQRLSDLPMICSPLSESQVVIYADNEAYEMLQKGGYPMELLQRATEASYGTEFLDYKMSVRSVKDLAEALAHIQQYSSKHSECIVTQNSETAHKFEQIVDAACIYTNVSTAFTDGGQFGFGAEVGISTQKLHARGPMGLDALTSYKYLVRGNGQTRG